MSWIQWKLPILIFAGIVAVIAGLQQARPYIVFGGILLGGTSLVVLVLSLLRRKGRLP